MMWGKGSSRVWCRWGIVPVFGLCCWSGTPALGFQEQPQPAVAPEGPNPAVAEEPLDLSAFERIETYHQKLLQLEKFRDDRGLETAELQERPSKAADEVSRLIGGLERLMLAEAQQIYERAMAADDPKVRDRLLERLADLDTIPQLSELRARAEQVIEDRTVDGTVYPTVEEAQAAAEKLRQKQAAEFEEVDKKDLEDLQKLKEDILNERITEAIEETAEENASDMLRTAVRLVLPQRRERMRELVRRYPNTAAAQEAQAILAALVRQTEFIAARKLDAALCAPVIFDQRWRRLKEILRDYPDTAAAAKAEEIFLPHAAAIPPMMITNDTPAAVEITVDVPYEKMTSIRLAAGETKSFPSAFPMMVRVNVADAEWDVYRANAGLAYVLRPCLDLRPAKPVLYPAPPIPPMESLPVVPLGDVPLPSIAPVPEENDELPSMP